MKAIQYPRVSGKAPHAAPVERTPRDGAHRLASRRIPSLVIKFVFLSCFILAPLLPVTGFLAAFGVFQVFELIAPNVQAGGIPIGGQTVYQAAIEINKVWNQGHDISVSDGTHTWVLKPSQLGLSVDALKTARNAYQIGHNRVLWTDIEQIGDSQRNGRQVPIEFSLDRDSARSGLQALSSQANIPPINASLSLQGSDLVAVPGVVGYNLDIERSLQGLEVNLRTVMNSRQFSLSLSPVAPRIGDVSVVKAEAEQLLQSPLQLQAYDPISNEQINWSVTREIIASWLRIETSSDQVTISIDDALATRYMSDLAGSLGPERWIDLGENTLPVSQWLAQGSVPTWIIRHNPTMYTVASGDTFLTIGWKLGIPYWRIAQANPDVDQKTLRGGEQIIIPSKDDLLPLPVILNKRIVISISQQRMWTYQDGNQLQEYVISTGIDRSPTQPGVYQVQTHELSAYAAQWDLTMPHFLGIYEAWPGFMNGIHGLPTLSNGQQLWANVLGKPASYGCIILNIGPAEEVYNWAEDGVVVEIQR